jgi:hypothetical protein
MTETIENLQAVGSESRRPSRWRRYLGAGALGFATALTSFILMFAILAKTGNLPPPAITHNLCIDEKLAFMRDHPPVAPNFLTVGSSVAWRHIDSSILASAMPGTVPYNGAFCGLRITQTRAATHWLLDRLPTVHDVLLVASPEDFEVCSREQPSAFDVSEADRFVFQDTWRWGFYFRYFDPVSLVRNASNIARFRTQSHGFEPLIMTRYGDAPEDPPKRDRLVYDAVRHFDPACFNALYALARELQAAGITFTVVNTPLNPLWEKRYDPGAKTRKTLNAGIDAALAGTGATHWDGNTAFTEGPDSFSDAIHLRWPAAQRFTQLLIDDSLSE